MIDVITAAAENVLKAKEAFEAAEKAESAARNVATDARNRLNEAQRAFDKAVVALRVDAPRASDWKASEGRQVEFVARNAA